MFKLNTIYRLIASFFIKCLQPLCVGSYWSSEPVMITFFYVFKAMKKTCIKESLYFSFLTKMIKSPERFFIESSSAIFEMVFKEIIIFK